MNRSKKILIVTSFVFVGATVTLMTSGFSAWTFSQEIAPIFLNTQLNVSKVNIIEGVTVTKESIFKLATFNFDNGENTPNSTGDLVFSFSLNLSEIPTAIKDSSNKVYIETELSFSESSLNLFSSEFLASLSFDESSKGTISKIETQTLNKAKHNLVINSGYTSFDLTYTFTNKICAYRDALKGGTFNLVVTGGEVSGS